MKIVTARNITPDLLVMPLAIYSKIKKKNSTGKKRKERRTISFISLPVKNCNLLVPKTVSMKKKNPLKYKEKNRKNPRRKNAGNGFFDLKINRLHAAAIITTKYITETILYNFEFFEFLMIFINGKYKTVRCRLWLLLLRVVLLFRCIIREREEKYGSHSKYQRII